ncbi:MAG TPA: succinate dehydrogenase assembly factor 2 [Acetobacteraceae bacterium]
MNEPDAGRDVRRRRLLYRATHRGTRETDLLVGGFVALRLAALTEAEIDALEAIMDLPDVDLAEWLTGRRPIPPEHDTLVLRQMRAAAGR